MKKGTFENPWKAEWDDITSGSLKRNGWHIDEDGDKHKLKNGKRHNENGPATVCVNRYKAWRLNDKLYFTTTQSDGEQVRGLIRWLEDRLLFSGNKKNDQNVRKHTETD